MSTATLPESHILIDEKGVAWIRGTKTRVTQIVLDKLAWGWSPEEIHYQHYGQYSMAQIHAAFCYYYDHQTELDAEIERLEAEHDRARAAQANSPLIQRLRQLKEARRLKSS